MVKPKELCPYCNHYRTEISRHIRLVHEKTKPFICDICGKACSLNYNLKEHIRLCHSKLKLYTCFYCELSFGTPGNRNSHIFNKHINTENKRASPGENLVMNVLRKYDIKFEREKSFQNLRSPKDCFLRYDFSIYITEPNRSLYLLIEYDGEHHGKPIRYRGIPLEDAINICNYIKEHDNLKNWYAFNNNIPLLRLTFQHNTKIEDIIVRFIKEHTLLLG